MIDLNDTEQFATIDTQGMLAHALNLPAACADAWLLGQRECQRLELSQRLGRCGDGLKQIVVIGMGGSAMGGDLLTALVADECRCPVFVLRGYELPAFVSGPQTLVIGCTHSGNTEETLSAFDQARQRGTALLAVTTGGEIARLADGWGAPVLRYAYESQPRAALGYSFILLINLLCHLGCAADKTADLSEAVDVMRVLQREIGPTVPVATNPAKRLAGQLMERLPVVYGAGLMEPVARRWKTQLNENAKRWAFFETMPELNHNAVVGYERSEGLRTSAGVIMLRSRYDSQRIQARWRITHDLLLHEGLVADQVHARGQSRLAQMLSLIHYGDLMSVYLALASNVDPTPVSLIAYLKEQLARAAH
jgi:glucose/mannose-6-phosphate isomerase